MKTARLLILMLLMSAVTAVAQPTHAARLASIEGEAQANEVRESADFKLGKQSEIEIRYDTTKNADDCSVHVRIYRKKKDRWLVVNTALRTTKTTSGTRTLTLPEGSYRLQVVAKQAAFTVSVDN